LVRSSIESLSLESSIPGSYSEVSKNILYRKLKVSL
jgi:hypothetical protein